MKAGPQWTLTCPEERFNARRDFICHGRIFDFYASKNFARLAEYIEADEKSLEEILPDEKPLADNYRRLLGFYRDSHIRKNEEGKWEAQSPLSEGLLNPFLRPWGPALRTRIEMGLYRPAELSGLPSVNVSFSSASFRRQSNPEQGSTKRAAEEQPPEKPFVKAARGLDYPDARLETKGDIKDGDAIGVAKLQTELQAPRAELAYRAPKVFKIFLNEQIGRLEKELEQVDAAIRKKYNKKAGKGNSKR